MVRLRTAAVMSGPVPYGLCWIAPRRCAANTVAGPVAGVRVPPQLSLLCRHGGCVASGRTAAVSVSAFGGVYGPRWVVPARPMNSNR